MGAQSIAVPYLFASGESASGPPARRRLQDATNATINGTITARQRRAAQMMNTTDSLSATIGRGLVLGERQVQVQSPKLTMGVSTEDPCKPAGDEGASLHSVPPLRNGVSGSFNLPPGSMCERGLGVGGLQADTDPVSVSVALFDANTYASVATDRTGTPVAAVKMRRSSGDVVVHNRSEVMLYCQARHPISSCASAHDANPHAIPTSLLCSNANPHIAQILTCRNRG